MEKQTIYCPSCGRKVGEYDGRATIPIGCNCKKCNKRVRFNPDTGKTELKKLPTRETSSGKRFY